MNKKYLDKLVNDIHSSTIATLNEDGYPQTRIIDMMLYDEKGIYFLTAKGKEFYEQLMKQKFIALSATKDKIAISLRGKIKNIHNEKLDEIFLKNTYMNEIYPDDTRSALEVFMIYDAKGEYFDISDPAHIYREQILIGNHQAKVHGYYVGEGCIGCKLCYSVCPQKCINIKEKPVVIEQNHCLHCGRCATICPQQVIKKV